MYFRYLSLVWLLFAWIIVSVDSSVDRFDTSTVPAKKDTTIKSDSVAGILSGAAFAVVFTIVCCLCCRDNCNTRIPHILHRIANLITSLKLTSLTERRQTSGLRIHTLNDNSRTHTTGNMNMASDVERPYTIPYTPPVNNDGYAVSYSPPAYSTLTPHVTSDTGNARNIEVDVAVSVPPITTPEPPSYEQAVYNPEAYNVGERM
ncbi:uncharacterized protein LOC127843666 isoform X3 [Dreissena polymorpha]|uniref:uncharacterized protein LOC127843666 isoform X3 n=1 Tax=Dreissena polymorpha TaxID=45954 RepID=UPI0022641CB7|nr:uncharacterized protein LOC127843666 isoform X3 [Dreissena polymorpha]